MSENTGWIFRNITDSAKADEIRQMYESLGFTVKIEDFDPTKYPMDCNECMKECPENFKVIFTLLSENKSEDLFDV